jgi:predicted neutral ceramidase superfamily lipid hydrolase
VQRVIACVICAGSLIATGPADARGLGRFLGGLVARGAVSGVTHGMRKSYTPDVLTVDQLVQCLKKASALDQESNDVESKRTELRAAVGQIDRLKTQIETKRATLNRYSQQAVDDFNADVELYNAAVNAGRSRESYLNAVVDLHNANVESYNAVCAKQYCADDMEQARKLAGI